MKVRPVLFVVFLWLVCLLLIGFTVNTYRLYSHADVIKEQDLLPTAEDNVFRIIAQSEYGVGGGTAYAINTAEYGTLVITNEHICDMDPVDGVFLLDQDTKVWPTKVRRKGRLTDLCILEPPEDFVKKHKGLRLARTSTALVTGQILYVYGHPGLRKLTASSGAFVNETWIPTFGEYLESKVILVDRADIAIFPGSSGSPVLNEDGLVVGTVFAYEGPSNIALIIPLRSMVDFLRGEP